MDRKGILLPSHENFVAEAILLRVKFPNKIAKWVTKPVLLRLIIMIDNIIINRASPKIKAILIPFVDAAFAGKLEEMRRLKTDLIVNFVDWKHVSPDTELYVVDSWTRVIVSHTMALAEHLEGVKRENEAYG